MSVYAQLVLCAVLHAVVCITLDLLRLHILHMITALSLCLGFVFLVAFLAVLLVSRRIFVLCIRFQSRFQEYIC